GAKSSRHHNKTLGIFYKHNLTHKKIIKRNQFVLVDKDVSLLFEGKKDIQTHRLSLCPVRTAVAGFHDSASSPGDDTITVLNKLIGDLFRHLIVGMKLWRAGRSKNGDARSD